MNKNSDYMHCDSHLRGGSHTSVWLNIWPWQAYHYVYSTKERLSRYPEANTSELLENRHITL